MALNFIALDPTFALVGAAPTYRVYFVDSVTGLPTDPDAMLSLEILIGGVLQRSFVPPDIIHPATGLYTVTDVPIDEPGVLELRWTYDDAGTIRKSSAPFEVVATVSGTGEEMIRDYVYTQLGEGVMWVGLPARSFEIALRKAKTWYAMRRGQRKRIEMLSVPMQTAYAMPADCWFVTEVVFQGLSSGTTEALGAFGIWGFTQLGLANVPAEEIWGAGGGQGFYSSLVQSLQYADMGRRILNGDPTWEYREYGNELWLFPQPKVAVKIIVDYASKTVDLDNMNPIEEYYLQEYTLAECKHALGLIRRKFSGYATAQGEHSLDGDSLVAEANDMRRELDEGLRKMGHAGWIITG